MDTTTFQDITDPITNAVTTFAIIAHADGSFTSMPKSVYDTLPSNSSTPQANSTES
jgi:hypothetical protein